MPDFDAWLIAWPPGGQVALHDHGASAGAIRVIEGALTEAVPWRDDGGQLCLARRELHGGTTLGFAPGHVHDVTNESGLHALSLHVYSPALTFMTQYDVTADGLVARDVCWSASGETDAGGSVRHRPPRRRTPEGAGQPVTRADGRRAAGRRTRRDRPGRPFATRRPARGGCPRHRHPPRAPARRGRRLWHRRRRRAQRARVAARSPQRPHPARGHRVTTNRSSWRARRGTPRVSPRRRSESSGSPGPPTWQEDFGPGRPGAPASGEPTVRAG